VSLRAALLDRAIVATLVRATNPATLARVPRRLPLTRWLLTCSTEHPEPPEHDDRSGHEAEFVVCPADEVEL
jgi:hypothetical protein